MKRSEGRSKTGKLDLLEIELDDAEHRLVAIALRNPDALRDHPYLCQLCPDWFHYPILGRIWESLVWVVASGCDGDPVDELIRRSVLNTQVTKRQMRRFLGKLTQRYPRPHFLEQLLQSAKLVAIWGPTSRQIASVSTIRDHLLARLEADLHSK